MMRSISTNGLSLIHPCEKSDDIRRDAIVAASIAALTRVDAVSRICENAHTMRDRSFGRYFRQTIRSRRSITREEGDQPSMTTERGGRVVDFTSRYSFCALFATASRDTYPMDVSID